MWDDAKALNGLAATLALLAVVALAAAAAFRLARAPAFAFGEVVVTGPLARTSAPHLEAVIRDELRGTFFTLDLDAARAALTRLPWVRSVALRRQWPARLEVTIDEHVPLARWNDGGLVNTFGETFVAPFAGELPQFRGPDGWAGEITARYAEWKAQLAPLALDLREIAVSARGGWRVRTLGAGGPLTLELGRDEPAVRLARFIAAHGRTLGALARAGTPIDHVDLRYRNGFAARVPGFREPARKAS